MNEWIKVENGAPEDFAQVLISDGDNIMIARYHTFDQRGMLSMPWFEDSHGEQLPGKVTHWMRLPKVPNE